MNYRHLQYTEKVSFVELFHMPTLRWSSQEQQDELDGENRLPRVSAITAIGRQNKMNKCREIFFVSLITEELHH